jgi:hypothetical protein
MIVKVTKYKKATMQERDRWTQQRMSSGPERQRQGGVHHSSREAAGVARGQTIGPSHGTKAAAGSDPISRPMTHDTHTLLSFRNGGGLFARAGFGAGNTTGFVPVPRTFGPAWPTSLSVPVSCSTSPTGPGPVTTSVVLPTTTPSKRRESRRTAEASVARHGPDNQCIGDNCLIIRCVTELMLCCDNSAPTGPPFRQFPLHIRRGGAHPPCQAGTPASGSRACRGPSFADPNWGEAAMRYYTVQVSPRPRPG